MLIPWVVQTKYASPACAGTNVTVAPPVPGVPDVVVVLYTVPLVSL